MIETARYSEAMRLLEAAIEARRLKPGLGEERFVELIRKHCK